VHMRTGIPAAALPPRPRATLPSLNVIILTVPAVRTRVACRLTRQQAGSMIARTPTMLAAPRATPIA